MKTIPDIRVSELGLTSGFVTDADGFAYDKDMGLEILFAVIRFYADMAPGQVDMFNEAQVSRRQEAIDEILKGRR